MRELNEYFNSYNENSETSLLKSYFETELKIK